MQVMVAGAARWTWVLYALFVVFATVVNFPGRLTLDTLDMVTQGLHPAVLNTWHAPVVTWLYALPTPLFGQPGGALVVQALLLFLYPAVALGALVVLGPRQPLLMAAQVAIALGLVGLTALLVGIVGQVLRDVVLAGAMLSLLATVDLARRAGRGRSAWAATALCFAALLIAVRPTNAAIAWFAAALVAVLTLRSFRLVVLAILAITIAAAVAVPLVGVIDTRVLVARPASPAMSLIIFDAAGISFHTGQDLFADLPGWPSGTLPAVEACYTPRRWDPFKWGECRDYAGLFEAAMQREGAPSSQVRWWIDIILRHPGAWARHRLAHALELSRNQAPALGWGEPYAVNTEAFLDVLSGRRSREQGIVGETHGIDMTGQIALWEMRRALAPFHRVAVRVFLRRRTLLAGVGLSLAALAWSAIRRARTGRADPVAILAAGLALGNAAMLLVFSVADEARYLLPTVLLGIVAVLRVAAAELEARSPARGPRAPLAV